MSKEKSPENQGLKLRENIIREGGGKWVNQWLKRRYTNQFLALAKTVAKIS